jgi:hypothetical protein
MLRPPVSNKRLEKLADGRVQLTMKRALYDGTRAIAMTPRELMRRLAAIVPPPRVHSTRYWGVFAPASKVRPKILLAGKERRRGCSGPPSPDPETFDNGGAEEARTDWELRAELDDVPLTFGPPPMPDRKRYLDWSQLLRRVFAADLLTCEKCGGRRKVTAFLPSSREAREVLDRLGYDATAPPIAAARAPPHQEAFELPVDDPGVDEQYPDCA